MVGQCRYRGSHLGSHFPCIELSVIVHTASQQRLHEDLQKQALKEISNTIRSENLSLENDVRWTNTHEPIDQRQLISQHQFFSAHHLS